MVDHRDEEARSSQDDDTPGSQGEIEAGSEGDFKGPDADDEGEGGSPQDEDPSS